MTRILWWLVVSMFWLQNILFAVIFVVLFCVGFVAALYLLSMGKQEILVAAKPYGSLLITVLFVISIPAFIFKWRLMKLIVIVRLHYTQLWMTRKEIFGIPSMYTGGLQLEITRVIDSLVKEGKISKRIQEGGTQYHIKK